MEELTALKTTDSHACHFVLFSSLEQLWKQACARSPELAPFADDRRQEVLLVVDQNVWEHHGQLLSAFFGRAAQHAYLVPSGESSKQISRWSHLLDHAFTRPLRRTTPLVAIGGGVTGDLAGFAAASLMRGLPLVHIPTTLLAMVDSAIGGKTGVNHPYGKNTIGAFYHPSAVLFHTGFLRTLPTREWLCGLSEVFKYGYIQDESLLENAARLAEQGSFHGALDNESLLEHIIRSSVRIKAGIVGQDAREAGKRAWLNFGHTFGHALETLDGYKRLNHGEAIYAGMLAALYVSQKQGARVDADALLAMKNRYALNLQPYTAQVNTLVTLMKHDKKNRDEAIQLVLLQGPASPVVRKIHDHAMLEEAWQYVFDVLA